MPKEGVNELYSPAARTAIRLSEVDGNNHIQGQLIDVRMHRLSTFKLKLNEDGSVNVLSSGSDFYSNGRYEKGIEGDKRGIKPDQVVQKLRAEGHNIDPTQTEALEAQMLNNPNVWAFEGGQAATGEIARIAEIDGGNKMGSCVYLPHQEGESQMAFCLEHEFNENAHVTMTATMHVQTPNGLISSTILTDEIGWMDTPSGTPSTPIIHENIQRGLDTGMTYGSPSGM